MLHSSGRLADTAYHHIGKRGPYLLLLHGWNNTWESWASFVPELATEYQVLIPDIPGFGNSVPKKTDDGWSTSTYRRWLSEWLNDISVDHLAGAVGHSFGGKILGWSYLLQHRAALPPTDHLFLLSPSGVPNRLSLSRKILQATLKQVPTSLKRADALRQWRKTFYQSWLNEQDYIDSNAFQEKVLHYILPEDIRAETVRDSHAPPLHLGWGELDSSVPLWMAYEWQALMPQSSEVLVFPGSEHHAHQEQPAAVLAWVRAHLKHEVTV